ncbi:type II toxin-antitoxin system VapB family antitoxin [Embleya sp. NPDC059237]|uniref:type II toxin-antitoxin system VapB family antitoxin n=1 Tax=Embleya sp. NPDC059237 TaxID=3346784 RepID=UPI003679254E
MAGTATDPDDDPLAAMPRPPGARGANQPGDPTLGETSERRRRILALTRLRAAVEDGAFDLGVLADKRNHRRPAPPVWGARDRAL